MLAPSLKSAFRSVTKRDDESKALLRLVRSSVTDLAGLRVLDVGCGTGRYLRLFAAEGCAVTGVDANPAIVEGNRKAGHLCVAPDDLAHLPAAFDLIIMSHVIEHFAPLDLLNFMDGYLDRLRTGGHLVIATPLMSPYFYDDFDHVKPYQPIGIDMVFGPHAAQVQYASRNKIQLTDIWFRRSPCRISFHRARYASTPLTRAVQAVDFGLGLLFIISFGMIGRADGWVGVFEKLAPAAAPTTR